MSEVLATDAPGRALVEAARQWGAQRLDALEVDRVGRLPTGLLEEIAEMGLFGLAVPTAYGGLGLDLATCCDVLAELARHDRSVATTIGLQAGLGTRGLIRFGSEAQRARWLPELASGRRIAAFAATEPGAGSDLAAITTRVAPDGGGIRVHGAKAFVTNGGFASLFTVLCQSPGLGGVARGQSLVLVDGPRAGISVGPEEKKLGLRGSSTTPVFFDEVALPADRLLGAPGEGTELTHHVLAWGRTAMAAGCIGTARAALDRTWAHVHTRRQFGRPLAAQEVVQRQIAVALATVHTLQALVRYTADAPDEASLSTRSLAAKILCSEGSGEVVDLGVQLHGGYGFIEESGMPLLLRDARITRIFEGANDVLAWRLGAQSALAGPPVTAARGGVADARLTAFVGQIEAFRLALVADQGARLLRRPLSLHRLGRLVALAEAATALADSDGLPSDVVSCALTRLEALAGPLLTPDRDDPRAIATRWLNQDIS